MAAHASRICLDVLIQALKSGVTAALVKEEDPRQIDPRELPVIAVFANADPIVERLESMDQVIPKLVRELVVWVAPIAKDPIKRDGLRVDAEKAIAGIVIDDNSAIREIELRSVPEDGFPTERKGESPFYGIVLPVALTYIVQQDAPDVPLKA